MTVSGSIFVLLGLSLLALCFWIRCACALGRLQPQRSSPCPEAAPQQRARRPGLTESALGAFDGDGSGGAAAHAQGLRQHWTARSACAALDE
jgi:hypothetical protein